MGNHYVLQMCSNQHVDSVTFRFPDIYLFFPKCNALSEFLDWTEHNLLYTRDRSISPLYKTRQRINNGIYGMRCFTCFIQFMEG